MPDWPPQALTLIPDASANDPSWPSPTEITPLDRVTDVVENRQPIVLDQRTETMREQVNRLVTMFNRIRDFFLDRDGTTATTAEPATFMRGVLDMGGNKITGMADGSDLQDAVNQDQLEQVQFEAEDSVQQVVNSRVILLDGSVVMQADLSAGNFRFITMADGTTPAAMVTKTQFDAFYGTFGSVPPTLLPRTGTPGMTGNLDMQDDILQPGHDVVNLANATNPGDIVNRQTLEDQFSLVGGEDLPVGSIVPYGGNDLQVPPENYLFCNGQEVSRLTYNALFLVIGTTYGSPSSGSVFKLPDLRGRVAAGIDDMGGLDAGRLSTFGPATTLGGRFGFEDHFLSESEMPTHSHSLDDATFADDQVAGVLNGSDEARSADNTVATDSVQTATEGATAGHQNVQPSLVCGWLIRA